MEQILHQEGPSRILDKWIPQEVKESSQKFWHYCFNQWRNDLQSKFGYGRKKLANETRKIMY